METCDEYVHTIGERHAKEVSASNPSLTKYKRKSPPSSHKALVKRTNSKRSPQPHRKVIYLGGGGGDEEDEGETEERRRKEIKMSTRARRFP